MSHMGDIAVELENLKADVKALRERVALEREIVDFWYERYLAMEKINDALNNRPKG